MHHSCRGERERRASTYGDKNKFDDSDDRPIPTKRTSRLQWLLHVTFTALDPVTSCAELQLAHHAHGRLAGGHGEVQGRYRRARDGRPVIDWHAARTSQVDGCDHDADDSSDDDDDDGDDETATRDSSRDGDEEERAIARAMADVKRVRAERERSVALCRDRGGAGGGGGGYESSVGAGRRGRGRARGERRGEVRARRARRFPTTARRSLPSRILPSPRSLERRLPARTRALLGRFCRCRADSEEGGFRAYAEGSSVFVFRSTTCGPTERVGEDLVRARDVREHKRRVRLATTSPGATT